MRTSKLYESLTRGLVGRMVANWCLRQYEEPACIRTEAHQSKINAFKGVPIDLPQNQLAPTGSPHIYAS